MLGATTSNLWEDNLTMNFKMGEFWASGCMTTDERVHNNIFKLAKKLQIIRDNYYQPIIITSGYRTPNINQKVGGVPDSLHLNGLAADCYMVGVGVNTFADMIIELVKNNALDDIKVIVYESHLHIAINDGFEIYYK